MISGLFLYPQAYVVSSMWVSFAQGQKMSSLGQTLSVTTFDDYL